MMGRTSWGNQVGGDPGGAMFRGRAGVVIEVAPNHFASWRLRGAFGRVDMEQEFDEAGFSFEPLIRVPTLTEVRFDLSGYLDWYDDRADRPAWAAATAGEIEPARAIEGRRP